MQTALFTLVEEQVKDLRLSILVEVGAALVELAGAARNAISQFFFNPVPALFLALNSGVRLV
jgi:hypothetical protein